MDLGHACPELLARCRVSDCTLDAFSRRVHAFLTDLLPLHPLFTDLRLVGRNAKDSPPLMSDLSNLEAWIYRRAWDNTLPMDDGYTHLGSDGKPTAASQGGLGFKLSVSNLKGWDGKVDIDCYAGARPSNTCNIMLPRKDRPEFHQQPLMERLLEVVVRHWAVAYASVADRGWHRAVNWFKDPSTSVRNIEVGWLTYVADPTIAEALPPDIAVRPLGPGAVFQLSDRFTSYERPEDVAIGQRVKNALASADRLRSTIYTDATSR